MEELKEHLKETIMTFHERREAALSWWNNLPDFANPSEKGKHGLATKYYPGMLFQSFTGKEIQKIWEREENTIKILKQIK